MSSEWREATLGEILNFRRGHDLPKTQMVDEGVPVIGSNGIIGYHNEIKAKAPCVSVGRSGNVGNPRITNQDCWAHNTTLYIDDFKGNDPFYIYYFLLTLNLSNYRGGSAVPTLNRNHIHPIQTKIPPLPEQKAIAHILGKLDDKIELNRQMNQTLEQMAQALFQSWFVDFDPVLDNAIMAGNEIPEALASKAENRRAVLAGHAEEGTTKASNSPQLPQELRSLFPETFTFNETLNKWIPEGWEGGNLGDRYFVKGGYAFKSKDFIEAEGTPVVKIKNIKADKTIDNSSFSYVKTEIAQQREDFWLETGDILMAMTGATVGKFGFIVKKGEDLIVLNQRVAKFYPKLESIRSLWFIYCFFDDNRNTDFIENTAEGSAQPNISANDIMSAPMILPEEKVLSFFEKVMSEKFNRIIANQKQTETLTQLREVLLPQLISGKLKVPEALLVLEKEMNKI